MKTVSGLHVGWLDTRIAKLARDHGGFLARFPWIMLSSLDSATDLSNTGVGRSLPSPTFLGRSVVMAGNALSVIQRERDLFHGFDEVWCFDKKPRAPKPPTITLVGPLRIDRDELPAGLVSFMRHSACQLALGDGVGLNYVTPIEEVATMVEELALRP